MTSSYTSNTGIEKPATGDQSGTWGDTVNVNMDIIDRVLNGVGAISLSGTTHTITTSDGSLSDGMYRVLVLGGSPSGTNTITVRCFLLKTAAVNQWCLLKAVVQMSPLPTGTLKLFTATGQAPEPRSLISLTTFPCLRSASQEALSQEAP